MHDYSGNFGGIHLIWWIIWVIILLWIFATPWSIPGQKRRKESPVDILKRRFASGEISKEEFEESKKILNADSNMTP